MSYGLSVRSGIDSSVLFSEDTPMMLFAGKGSNTTPALMGGGSTYYSYRNTSPIPSSEPMPVCFVANAMGVVTHLRQVYVLGGYWTALVYLNSSTAAAVYWFINPTGKAASAESYGMRIYNAAGARILDSGWGKFGVVKEITTISNSNGATASFTSLSKPAFMHMNSYIHIYAYTPLFEWRWYYRGLNYYTSGGVKLEDYVNYDTLAHAPGSEFEGGSGGTFNIPIINGADYD